MALVTRSEEPKAKNSYGMSFSKTLSINRLIYQKNLGLIAGRDLT